MSMPTSVIHENVPPLLLYSVGHSKLLVMVTWQPIIRLLGLAITLSISILVGTAISDDRVTVLPSASTEG